MSKKSRKRNKKILAAIGIGLGAAALASKKRDASNSVVEANDNAFDIPAVVTTPKKKPDSKMPSNLSKDTGKDNTQQKPRFGQVINKKGNIQTLKPLESSGLSFGISNREAGPNAFQNRPKKERIPLFESPKNKAIRLSTASGKANTAAQQMMSGYKSGGSVKGCGKALRGFGKAMKGKK